MTPSVEYGQTATDAIHGLLTARYGTTTHHVVDSKGSVLRHAQRTVVVRGDDALIECSLDLFRTTITGPGEGIWAARVREESTFTLSERLTDSLTPTR